MCILYMYLSRYIYDFGCKVYENVGKLRERNDFFDNIVKKILDGIVIFIRLFAKYVIADIFSPFKWLFDANFATAEISILNSLIC